MGDAPLQGEGDRFLIAEIREGSAEAFRRLVDRFGGRLNAFAAKRLRGSGIDSEDAVQETFLSLLRNIDRLDGVRSLQAYLFTILRRRIADLARARGPTKDAAPLDGRESSGGLQPASPIGTPSHYVRQEEARRMRDLVLADVLDTFLSKLKSEKKFRDLKVLELVFSCGRSQQTAATVAGTSEPTVSRICKSTIESLQKLVRQHRQAEALVDLPSGDGVEQLVQSLWQENLFTCVKRSTLGSYALAVLDAEWNDYVRFHLEEVGCEYCQAHLDDVEGGKRAISETTRQRIFASSVGFLK